MAREYRPYPTRKESANRNLRRIIMLLIVVIIGGVILIKTYNQTESAAPIEDKKVPLSEVLPNAESQKSAIPEPRVTPTPDPGASEVLAPNLQSAQNEQQTTPIPAKEPQIKQPTASAAGNLTEAAANPAVNVIPETTASADVKAAVDKSIQLLNQGKIAASRDLLNSVLDEPMSPNARAAVKAQLIKLAETWLYGREVMADDKLCSYYKVQPGDKIALIAKKYKIPYELLMDINGIQRPEMLQAGQTLKVIEGPFNAVVYKGSFTMDLYLQRSYVKTYNVGLGKQEHETPTGLWRVASGGKMVKPTWTDPDTGKTYTGSSPDYPLGSRWIALEGIDGAAKGRTGFAIHGTKDPETIGTRSSRGCIRLYNGDVIEVYDRMVERVSEVWVKD